LLLRLYRLSFNWVALDQVAREALVEALGIVEIGLAEEIRGLGGIWDEDQVGEDQVGEDQVGEDQVGEDQVIEVPLVVFQVGVVVQ
jgi:hypothetical protein